MNINRIEILTGKEAELAAIDEIMLEAFPPEEQVPAAAFVKGVKAGKARLFAYTCEESVAAFAFVLSCDQLTYLLYLAVAKDMRGKSIGGYVLDDVTKSFPAPVALDIETLEDLKHCENADQRRKRKAFYQKHGFEDAGYVTVDAGIAYDTLSFGGSPTPEVHAQLMRDAYKAMGIQTDIYMRKQRS